MNQMDQGETSELTAYQELVTLLCGVSADGQKGRLLREAYQRQNSGESMRDVVEWLKQELPH
jgi:hypothetical protein